ncbi:MAG: V8-like Glu-specific endopeptidase, partial [Saprospiraceae bacterium]
MKHLSLTLCAIAIAILSNAQISQGGSPLSWQTDKIDLSELRFHTMPSFDEIIMRSEDDINNASKDVPFRFGKNFDVNLELSDGEWTDLPNGDRLWNLGIESIGAFSLNFLFSTFNLPEGGKLFIYNEDKSYKIGAFTSENNTPEKTLPTYPLPGERIIIEYYEPAAAAGLTELKIGRITHGYRDLDVIARGIGDSGTCNNNVICAEGDDWRDEINAVAMIVVGSNGICTGALVNNTANDGHPYFLTANHCTGGGVTNWVFRFNWQSPACGNNNPPQNTIAFQTVSGSAMLAQGTSADYALLEINSGNPIPLAYNPYYAGWDASGVNPTSQVGIHHPSGDLKKISFDTNPAGTASYGGATNWRIFNWEDGTTEPGSSGSPLFDQNHNIIGQLYGGEATCNNNVNDYYGKFDVTYPNVCQWLAPGCNTNVISGFNPDSPTSSGCTTISACNYDNTATVDDGSCISPITYFYDGDGDGYGTPDISLDACAANSNFVTNDLDCNDLDNTINPNATEVCDGVDNNCDGQIDEGVSQ